MEALKQYKKDCVDRHRYPEEPRYIETLAMMRFIYSKNFLPIQMIFYFTLEKESEEHYKLVRHHKAEIVSNLSFDSLYDKTMKLDMEQDNFVGFISKDCGIDYYVHIIQRLYPDKKVTVVWPIIPESVVTYL